VEDCCTLDAQSSGLRVPVPVGAEKTGQSPSASSFRVSMKYGSPSRALRAMTTQLFRQPGFFSGAPSAPS
jgi:hypothetical protein